MLGMFCERPQRTASRQDYWDAFALGLPGSAFVEAWRSSPGFPSEVVFGTDLDWYEGNKERLGRINAKTVARVRDAVTAGKADQVAATIRWPDLAVGRFPTTWWRSEASMWIDPDDMPTLVGASVLSPSTEHGELTAALRDAAWTTARRWVELLEPALLHGFCTGWDGFSALTFRDPYALRGEHAGHGQVAGYSWLTLLAPAVVEQLGGADSVIARAPVAVAEPMLYTSGGLAVLCRVGDSPASVPTERWGHWKDFLAPVLLRNPPYELHHTMRKPWLLEEDW